MAPVDRTALLELLDIQGDDARECAALLSTPANDHVLAAMAALRTRLGTFTAQPASVEGCTETDWIEALLRFAPAAAEYQRSLGIPAELTAAALADMGLQLRINRRVHGRFGLDTWGWLTLHMAGNMFRLGRLQYHLVRSEGGEPPAPDGEWITGLHIPEDGGLSPAAVDESLAFARAFLGRHFPDKPVRFATCDSWMLDPYLSERLPDSNIAAFARRFTVHRCSDAASDAVYFTFRTRDMANLAQLPRETSLQRVVLERIDDGGTWQLGHGYLELPAAQ
ncbi:hypothetical protein BIU82_00530 [Arthrobacter sp. SW1]|uniref:acyltransferase domain-containing protein n=1 Tax=Arthrobacter sp. SW1 TaxID=1920889 RepID=UPI000877E83D|nr:acyltransferase domain-containing protein [Arthrobacter sp. SW1]OFI39596.1 hypothetical protein BIU82_00530 [Arthrobacter sp. SW1]